MKKRVLSLMLVLILLCASAAGAETLKRERVFAVVRADGTLETAIDNVTLENADALEVIEDASRLEEIENVGGRQSFSRDGERLVWQADGEDITYRGRSDRAPDVTPVVEMTLDGEPIDAAALAEKRGRLSVKVSYRAATDAPCLALSALLLDKNRIDNMTLENATLLTSGERTLLVGWAVIGADALPQLPASFSFSCDCDQPDLSWMMTVAGASPLKALADALGERVEAGRADAQTLASCLTALRDGGEMPADDAQLTELFTQLAALKAGAGELDAGMDALNAGLARLCDNNEALNAGASQLFDALLSGANEQLAAAGLDAAGIRLPELTQENYAQALEGALEQLDPDTLSAKAEAAAREQVAQAVEAQRDTVRAAVEAAARAQVLEAVLNSAGVKLSAEEYPSAVAAGQLSQAQAAQLDAAVAQQMADDAVQARIEAALEAQIAQLVAQNLASDAVRGQIADAVEAADAAREQLAALKARLDQLSGFVGGLAQYTQGVADAAEGAAQLKQGSGALADGLSQGVNALVERALALLDGDVAEALAAWDETTGALAGAGSWDLLGEGMRGDLLFIIRSKL